MGHAYLNGLDGCAFFEHSLTFVSERIEPKLLGVGIQASNEAVLLQLQ